MRQIVIALFTASCGTLTSASAYDVMIAVSFGEHRVFTPTFQTQTLREVQHQLRPFLGPDAEIEVVSTHPLLASVATVGVGPALDAWDEVSTKRIILVRIDHHFGMYRVSLRSYDGPSGLATPLVRRAQTGHRPRVVELIVQEVRQDFALSGELIREGDEAFLRIREMPGRDPSGNMFVLSRVSQENVVRVRRVPHAYAEVLSRVEAGKWRVRLWLPKGATLPELKNVRYQAVSWPTGTFVPRLQLLDAQTNSAPLALRVRFQHPKIVDQHKEVVSDAAGLADAGRTFPHLVLVQIYKGDLLLEEFPLALTGAELVVHRLSLKQEDPARTSLKQQLGHWQRRLLDDLLLANYRFEEIQKAVSQSLPEALQKARAAQESLDQELDMLAREAKEMTKAASNIPGFELKPIGRGLEELRQYRVEIAKFIERVDGVVKASPAGASLALSQMAERARLFEVQGDIDEALVWYANILKVQPNQKDVADHASKLRATWKIQNDAHAQARQFLLNDWLAATTASEIKTLLPQAHKSLAECKSQGDPLSLIKVRKANAQHLARLKQQLEAALKSSPADVQPASQAIEGLLRFHAEVVGKKES